MQQLDLEKARLEHLLRASVEPHRSSPRVQKYLLLGSQITLDKLRRVTDLLDRLEPKNKPRRLVFSTKYNLSKKELHQELNSVRQLIDSLYLVSTSDAVRIAIEERSLRNENPAHRDLDLEGMGVLRSFLERLESDDSIQARKVSEVLTVYSNLQTANTAQFQPFDNQSVRKWVYDCAWTSSSLDKFYLTSLEGLE